MGGGGSEVEVEVEVEGDRLAAGQWQGSGSEGVDGVNRSVWNSAGQVALQ